MQDLSLATRLAELAHRIAQAPLPPDVAQIGKWLIADQLGVQIRGATLPNVAPVTRLVRSAGGAAEATVVGGGRTSAGYAAYANGTFGHACQYDDSHQLAWHPGSCVVPAVLAAAEREGSAGAGVLGAIVAGTEVMAWLGAATTAAMQGLGWHGAKVLGVFGAAVGAGLVLGLNVDQLAQSIAVAASDSSGTMEYDTGGGEVKRLHTGLAARSGCEAALLAREGMTAPLSALDGAKGVLALIARVDAAQARAAVEAAARRFQITDLIFRLHPTVGTVHAPLDAIEQLRRTHEFDWREIECIRVGLAEYAYRHGAAIVRPHDTLSAQFSLAYSCALLLTRGADRPEDYFDSALWRDHDVLTVADRVQPYVATFPDGYPMLSAMVEITLRDGRSFGATQRGFRGHPSNPATDVELEAKLRNNLVGLRGDAEASELLRLTRSVDTLPDVAPIARLLSAH